MKTHLTSCDIDATAMRSASRTRLAIFLLGVAAATVAALTFSFQVTKGLTLFEFTDEMEQFVAAQMFQHGYHLYKDVFTQHGPVPYMIAHFYTSVVSHSDFSFVRLSEAILAIASCVALVCSPALKTATSRLWALALYLLFLSSVWILQGLNTLIYWPISGFLFSIVFAQSIAPMLIGEKPNSCGLFISGISLALVCFCAYTNGPSALLLTLSLLILLLFSPDRLNTASYSKQFIFGASLATIAVGAWLWLFGDLLGFYVYHFYFNQYYFSEFIKWSPKVILSDFLYSMDPRVITHSFALSLFVLWLYIFVDRQRRASKRSELVARVVAFILIASAVILTNPRGDLDISDSSFVIVNFIMFSISCSLVLEKNLVSYSFSGLIKSIASIIGAIFLAYQVYEHGISWFGVPQNELFKYSGVLKPERSAIHDFIRSITKKDRDFLALNYNSIEYIKLDRLPASGNLWYFQVQAAYNKRPKFHYKIDICADIKSARPTVIWFFNWLIPDKDSIDEYEPCVLSLITAGYSPLTFNSPWFIRNDHFAHVVATAPLNAAAQLNVLQNMPDLMELSPRLSPYSPIRIIMTANNEKRRVALRRIGILFSTFDEQNSGEAELYLEGPEHAKLIERFTLSKITNNRFHYFDVDSKRYTTGELRSVTGGGIGTWESRFGETLTCLIYEYVDGTRRFTPACPVM